MCGCNKNRNNNIGSRVRGSTLRPGLYNRTSSGNINAATQVRSQSVAPVIPKNESGITSAKRKIQALRREAILKSLGK